MKVYTFQLAKWRALKAQGIPYLDTTVKSGAIQVAPLWEMALGVKAGTLSPEEYTRRYNEILEYWFFADPLFWEWLISHEVIALGCYCKSGDFCHRHLLVQYLKRITAVEDLGEIQ